MSTVSVAAFNQSLEHLGKGVLSTARTAIESANNVRKDSNTLEKVGRFVTFVFMGINHHAGRELLPKLTDKIGNATAITDAFTWVSSVSYFVNQKFKNAEGAIKDSAFKIAANVSWIVGGVSYLGLWLNEMHVIDFANIATKIGRVPVLNVITKIPVANSILGVFAVGYVFVGIDAVKRLATPGNSPKQMTQAWLDLAHAVSEVAFKVLIIAAVSNVAAIVALGVVATSLGVVSFLHEKHNEAALQ